MLFYGLVLAFACPDLGVKFLACIAISAAPPVASNVIIAMGPSVSAEKLREVLTLLRLSLPDDGGPVPAPRRRGKGGLKRLAWGFRPPLCTAAGRRAVLGGGEAASTQKAAPCLKESQQSGATLGSGPSVTASELRAAGWSHCAQALVRGPGPVARLLQEVPGLGRSCPQRPGCPHSSPVLGGVL